ncbi:MAG: ABC transporter ATP-binding protein/permease [Lachnospiraceae bacterium]|nr:ABC transporter ATP-binding protein/permease [Lachnospiraceae bacterium]
MDKNNKKAYFFRLFALFMSDTKRCLIMLLLLIISGLLTGIAPRVLGFCTDVLAKGLTELTINWGDFFKWAAVATLVYIMQFLTRWYAGRLSASLAANVAKNLRTRVEEKLWKMPLNYYDINSNGDIMSRTTNDIDNIVDTLNKTGGDLIYYVLQLVCMIVMMLTLSWELAIATMLIIPLSFFVVKLITKKSRPQFKKQWEYMGELNGNVEESFKGHDIIKSYGLEEEFFDHFEEQNDGLYRSSYKATAYSNTVQPFSRFFTNLNFVIVAIFGAYRIIQGTMTIGEAQAFIQYSRQFQTPFTGIANMYSILQSGLASFERVCSLLDEDEEKEFSTDVKQEYNMKGEIEFRNVSFRYLPDKPLIENLNLKVKPGQMVAIVGGTGAGKTTLVNLLERFYDIQGGSIIFDGDTDIRDISRAALRHNIAMVLQDTWLYNGSIEDNLRYGLRKGRKITREEFLQACRDTFVDSFVRALPNGYKTIVNNEMSGISAGEKQLLTICRAFVSKPDILILDEATSSVDTRTEAKIQTALDRLREGRTSFVIAHRLSTIRNADIILVMDKGNIVEQGNHDELLKQNGQYASLYKAQFAGMQI